MVNLNVGCGPSGKDDWINIDWGLAAFLHKIPLVENLLLSLRVLPKGMDVRWPKNLLLHDCAKPLPFDDASVDNVFTSHFLEHLKKFQANDAVRDYHRVLRTGGLLRIIVPDLKVLAKKYLDRDIAFFERCETMAPLVQSSRGKVPFADLVSSQFYHDFNLTPSSLFTRLQAPFIRPHQWMYDFDSLKELLEGAGFRNVVERSYREGRMPDIDVLDTRPHESLYVEAEK